MPVILIDLDDTLVDDTGAAGEAIALTLQAVNLPTGQNAVDAALRYIRRLWAEHPHRRTGSLATISAWDALWLPAENAGLPEPVAESLTIHERQVWEVVITALGGDTDRAHTAATIYRQTRHRLLRPLPEVKEALITLSRRHSLWLATNGLPAHQQAKVVASGLIPNFDRLLISGHLGAAKCEPAFAEAVHAALRHEGTEVCLVVGDSPEQDLALAAHGGWPAVHLCRARPCPTQVNAQTAVTHVSSLSDVAALCRCSHTARHRSF